MASVKSESAIEDGSGADRSAGGGGLADGGHGQQATSGHGNVCRDYLRRVCQRGNSCRFRHPPEDELPPLEEVKGSQGGKDGKHMQDTLVFCQDHLNRGDCGRQFCRYLHCSREEYDEFQRSGYLTPHIRDQALRKGLAPDMAANLGLRPICKDFLKGECTRNSCRYRHVTAMQYDLELEQNIMEMRGQGGPPSGDFGLGGRDGPVHADGGYVPPLHERLQQLSQDGYGAANYSSFGSYSNYGSGYSNVNEGYNGNGYGVSGRQYGGEHFDNHEVSAYPPNKRMRTDQYQRGSSYGAIGSERHGPSGGHQGGPGGGQSNVQMLREENHMLKQQVEELKKQVNELSTTNNFLLEQNAQLRLGVKGATAVVSIAPAPDCVMATTGPGGTQVAVPVQAVQSDAAAVAAVAAQAAVVAQQAAVASAASAVPISLSVASSVPGAATISIAPVTTAQHEPQATVQMSDARLVSYPIRQRM